MNLIIKAALLGIITWIILILLIPFLSKKFLVYPNERSSHMKPIPSGGGISFVLVSCFVSSFLGITFPLLALPLSIVGFLDDLFGISAIIRYFFQLFTVILILLNSSLLSKYFVSLNQFEYIAFFIFLIIFGTAIINFINFMDGLDGFLVSNIFIIFTASNILFNQSLYLISGPLVGFAILNWQPAKVFMGDVGSTFLGAMYFYILVNTQSINNSFLILSMGFPLISDAFICILRRFSAGQNIFKAHKLHLYQRLYQAGLSHKKVSCIYAILTLIIAILISIDFQYLPLVLCSYLIIGFYLDRKIAIKFYFPK